MYDVTSKKVGDGELLGSFETDLDQLLSDAKKESAFPLQHTNAKLEELLRRNETTLNLKVIPSSPNNEEACKWGEVPDVPLGKALAAMGKGTLARIWSGDALRKKATEKLLVWKQGKLDGTIYWRNPNKRGHTHI